MCMPPVQSIRSRSIILSMPKVLRIALFLLPLLSNRIHSAVFIRIFHQHFVYLILSLLFMANRWFFVCIQPLTYRRERKYIRDYLESSLFFRTTKSNCSNDKPQLMVDLSTSHTQKSNERTDKTCNFFNEAKFMNSLC